MWKWATLFVLLVTGCQFRTLPDPNDPSSGKVQVIRQNLQWASNTANARVLKGEISRRQAKQLVETYAERLTKSVAERDFTADNAWMYGDILVAAGRWELARKALQLAIAHAPNADRRVNDSIRLAQVEAQTGDIPGAIKLAQSTFTVGPKEKAPILPGILLTVVPAARGKGYDLQLAQLLEGAIRQHEQAVVDTTSQAGKLFFIARPHHIENAWRAVIALYLGAGRKDLAQRAFHDAQQDMAGPGVLVLLHGSLSQ